MSVDAELLEKAYRVNLLKRLQAGKPLTGDERADLARLTGADQPTPATWPSQAAAARECALTPARLRSLSARGCPLESSDAGGIPQLPVWRWLWLHRDDIDRKKTGSGAEEKLRAERLRLGNERLSASHLSEATKLATRVLTEAVTGVRRRLGPHVLADLRGLDDDTALAAAIVELIESASVAALGAAK